MRIDRTVRASLLSVSTDLLLIAIKGGLALLTGSLALAADAFHSLSDLVVSISVFVGILLRRLRLHRLLDRRTNNEPVRNGATQAIKTTQPHIAGAQETKTSGYWIESLIAAFVSLLILYMPVEIIAEVREAETYDLEYAWVGILGTLICITIIYFISRFKIIVGRDTGSPALEADGYHSRVDIFTSVAVLLSLMGQIIGIALDPVVAVIIAVLIGITGIDLFISSIISLVKGTDLHQLSIWESLLKKVNWLLEKLSHSLLGHRLSMGSFKQLLSPRMAGYFFVIVMAAYLASGLTLLMPWEHGVRMRFGKIVDGRLEAGLHYHLPAPIETIVRTDMARVRRVEVGFRTDPSVPAMTSDLLWETKRGKARYRKIEQESTMLAGDESLIDLSMVVHYHPTDTVTHWLHIKNIEEVIRGLTESSAREVLSSRSSDLVFSESRTRLMEEIDEHLSTRVEQLGLGIQVLAVYTHDLHPPLDVVPAFRDVFSAKEDKARLLSEAQAYRNEALPRASGKRTQNLAEAESFAVERRLHAEGDGLKFEQVAAAYAQAPALTRYRLFLETLESGLAGKEKIIADPLVNQGDYRHWLFAPEQPPTIQVDRKRMRGGK